MAKHGALNWKEKNGVQICGLYEITHNKILLFPYRLFYKKEMISYAKKIETLFEVANRHNTDQHKQRANAV